MDTFDEACKKPFYIEGKHVKKLIDGKILREKGKKSKEGKGKKNYFKHHIEERFVLWKLWVMATSRKNIEFCMHNSFLREELEIDSWRPTRLKVKK